MENERRVPAAPPSLPRGTPRSVWSAQRVLSKRQAVALAALAAALSCGLALDTYLTGAVVVGSFITVFLATTSLRLGYFVKGKRARQTMDDRDEPLVYPLPVYSILVPLYREANVVPDLLDALDRLEYPFDRVQVLLLTEVDDRETFEACQRHLRPGWRIVTVPDGHPRTKPRALNAALGSIDGEFFTIYDAEDRPEPDQLRKAVRAFKRSPASVACLQARLDYYNARQNLLTKWFTCEYATHFGLYLEGISASGHPMPLGGTSTHFRTGAVRAVGGWDEWNVTEDCELGMRLAAAGLEARTLDSVTLEEAVPELRAWVRQRSRWVKGFAQTALVLTRAPLEVGRALGWKRYAAALLTVGGVPLVLTAQLVFWTVLCAYIALGVAGVDVRAIEAFFPEPLTSLGMVSLVIGNFAILLAHVSVVYGQGRYEFVRYAATLPLYWLLLSVGAWRGIAQLPRRPHFWEKTTHGLAQRTPAPSALVAGRRFRITATQRDSGAGGHDEALRPGEGRVTVE
jgi:cellulose synthase/poly-beta-1,6-N-acetylglucosamine synthase-like glycosyltransferase